MSGSVRAAVACLVFTLLTSGASQGEPQRIEAGGYHFLIAPVPNWVERVPAPIRPSAGAAVRYHLVDDQVQVGENVERFSHRIAGAYDKAGLQEISQFSVDFDPGYQTLVLHYVVVQRGAERVDRLRPDRVTLVRREKDLERMTYDGTVTAAVALDDVRVGDRVEYAYSLIGRNPILGPKFSAAYALAWPVPVDTVHVRVRTPISRPLRIKVHGSGLQPRLSGDGTHQVVTLRTENQVAVQDEGDTPPWYIPVPWVQFTEFASWGEVVGWGVPLYRAPAAMSPELSAAVERIRASAKDRRDAVRQALRLVQDEVRYLAVALGESTHRPAPPDEVYRRRFGDCKDKTALLLKLLHELGIPAHPALVSSTIQRRLADTLPSPAAFDHVIVAVDVDGRRFWLDGTRTHQSGRLELLGFTPFGRALVLTPGVEDLEEVVAPAEYRSGLRSTERFVTPDFRKSAMLEVESVYHGDRAEYMRWYLAANERDQIAKNYLNDYAALYPKIELAGPLKVTDDPQENSLTVAESYRVPKLFDYRDGLLVAQIFSLAIEPHVRKPRTVNRAAPLALPYPLDIRHTVVFELPPDTPMVPGTPSSVRSDAVMFRTSDRFADRVYSVDYEYRTLKDAVAPAGTVAHLANVDKIREQLGARLFLPVSASREEPRSFLGRLKQAFAMPARAPGGNWADRLNAQVKLVGRDVDSGRLGDLNLSEALLQRGTSLSLLSRNQEAERDLSRAIALDPENAEAFLTRAELYAKLQQHEKAMADFAAVERLNPQIPRLLASRGRTYYYQGRFAEGQRDLQMAAEPADGAEAYFASLWLYLATMRLGSDGAALLDRYEDGPDAAVWPGPVVQLYRGRRKPDEVLAAARRAPRGEQPLRLCEAWFYIGQHHLLRGERDSARKAFEKSVATGVTMYLEHAYAQVELSRLK